MNLYTTSSRVLIVGAGFSGAVLAREFAEKAGISSLVIDQRNHIGGNCHTARDAETGVMEHVYGPHIFNTSNKEVWDYVQRHCTMMPYINRVKASTDLGVFSMPINLHTINQFFGKSFSPAEARSFVEGLGDHTILEPANFEEQALKFLGHDLYEAFFYGYTRKQWGCEPRELPAAILKRLPVRFNYDDNYYSSKYQGIPLKGYTELIGNILNHPKIEVKLSTSFDHTMLGDFAHTFYTGPIDEYFYYSEGRLGYRTVFWEKKTEEGDYQGNAVINYPGIKVRHTRVHEHKHFAPWEEHEKTIVFTEYSKETKEGDIPYYPKRLERDKQLLVRYRDLAQELRGISFLGRLATYRYMDMHHVIGEALEYSKLWIQATRSGMLPPVFPNECN